MKKGFTLLELLIAISITAIFLGVGYAGYRDFSRRQEVLVAKRQMISDLRLAQKSALTGNKPTSCTTDFQGFDLTLTATSPVTYQIGANCVNPSSPSNPFRTVIKTVNLGSNISISPTSLSSILFQALGRGVTFSGGGSSVTYTLSSSALGGASSANQTVVISQYGDIK